jgi:crotonobetainyl-CoA:carnitine CoA-transferase CaiB-like acyl-CoA transferase
VSHLYPIFRCLDGRVRICLLAPRQWRAMFGWLNEPHEFADPRYDMIVTRYRERDRLYPAIAALFADQKVADLVEQGHDRGVPVEAVRSPADLLLDQHLEARGAWADVTLPGGRAGRMPHGFLEIDGKRVGFRALLDEGTDDRRFRTRHAAPKSLANGNMRDSAVPPLTGLRVLDLGVIVVGAETGRLFADLGADVIKIESEAFPDGSRQSSRKGTVDSGTAWGHRGKRSLGLDLRDPRGRALFLQLASLSDVVLSNFRPGTLESLGIGIEQVRAVNPAIVMLDSSALGSTGPSSRRMGYGPLVRASAGLTSLWCDPDVPDGYCDAITVYPDHTAARAGATGALAALIARRHTGHGASVSVSQTEVMLTQLSAELLRESLIPGSLVAVGNHGELDAPCGVYPAAGEDQWCAITVRGDDQWRRLCEAIGAEDLAAETALNTAAGRVARRGVIDERVRSWTRARSPHEAMTLLQAVGVPAGAMLRPGELICDPHLRARKVFATLEQPALGPLTSERAPALFSRIAPAPLRPAPLQGENTREVVRELLGLSTSEINELVNRGILQDPASATVA